MRFVICSFVVLVGCGGEFTESLFEGHEEDGGGLGTGGAAEVDGGSTGGRASTGGSFSTGGAPEATGGLPGETGGVAATGGQSAATGGAQETGGSPSTGGDPQTTGGAPASTGGAPVTGGSPSTGGAALVTHSNGVGQTWQDDVPLGTYTQAQATKACEAWCAVNVCTGVPCTVVQGCIPANYYVVANGSTSVSWAWLSPNEGEVHTACVTVVGVWN